MIQLIQDTCDKHQGQLQRMGMDWSKSKSDDSLLENTEVEGAFFESKGDDGAGIFLSHNFEEAEKMLEELKRNKEDAKRFRRFFDALAMFIPLEDIEWDNGEVDFTKWLDNVNQWRLFYNENKK